MICEECKRALSEDRMIRCTSWDPQEPNGEAVEWLCGECLDKSIWYCHGCGEFCAGIPSYEFGPYGGFCDNCADEIADSDFDGDEEEEFTDGSLDW